MWFIANFMAHLQDCLIRLAQFTFKTMNRPR